MRGFVGLVQIAFILAALSGCPGPAERPSDRLVTIAIRADVTGFFPNPPFAYEAFTIDVNRSIFEPLVALDRDHTLVPGLAESWVNPDDRTAIFTLRPGLKFSDGRPVTTEDAAASIRAVVEKGWATAPALRSVESARALNEHCVEVRTRQPSFVLLSRLNWGFVIPEASVAKVPVPALGTGPYRLEHWKMGHEIVLTRNPHFRGPAAPFEKARLVVVEDPKKRIAMVREGRADAADQIPPEDVSRLTSDPAVRVHVRTSPRVLFLGLRVDVAPFSDPRVREALDLALDREEIRRRVYAGLGEVARQVVPKSIVGFDPELRPRALDRARARALLSQAGLPQGTVLTLDGPRNRYMNDAELVREVARQLAEVGLDVRPRLHEKQAYYRLIDSQESPLHLLSWVCNSGDAGEILDTVLHSRRDGFGLYNSTHLADRELDALTELAGQTVEAGHRAALLRQAIRHVSGLDAVLPLVAQPDAVIVSRRIDWVPPFNMAVRPETMSPAKDR